MRPFRYLLVALPLLPVTFLVLLFQNLVKLNKQAWDWTVTEIRSAHQEAIRNHFNFNTVKRITHDCDQ